MAEMDDKQLLEMAAKAAGMSGTCVDYDDRLVFLEDGKPASVEWNPLTDDGDALRLAVKLHIEFQSYAESRKVYAHSKELLGYGLDGTPSYQAHPYMTEEFGDDPCAATRRAITRAAASIGKES